MKIYDGTLEDVEDTWWLSSYSEIITYRSLPDTSKWLCKIEDSDIPGGRPSCLKVFAAGNSYLFSRFYTSIFMLLDLQHLSCLAEAIRLPCGSQETIRHRKNIHFLDQLRLHILTSHNSSSVKFQDEEVSDPYLMRWVLRLIHSISNSKTLRKSNVNAQRLSDIYQTFEKEKAGSWKIDLYQLVIVHEAVLITAAERVFTYALSDHIRAKDQDRIASSSIRWIHNIKHQMELDKFHLPMELEGPKTKKRGRPRKEMQIPPNAESSIMAQTRSQNKNGRNISAIDTLFSQSYVTTSPKKLNQKSKEENSSATKRKATENPSEKKEKRVRFDGSSKQIDGETNATPANSAKKLDRGPNSVKSDKKINRKRKPAPSQQQNDKDKDNLSMSLKTSTELSKVELDQMSVGATTSNQDSVTKCHLDLLCCIRSFSKASDMKGLISAMARVRFDTDVFSKIMKSDNQAIIYRIWQAKIYPQFHVAEHIAAIKLNPDAYKTTKDLASHFKILRERLTSED